MYIKMTSVDKVIWTKNAVFSLLQALHAQEPSEEAWTYKAFSHLKVASKAIFDEYALTAQSTAKEGLSSTTVDKLYACFKAWYSHSFDVRYL